MMRKPSPTVRLVEVGPRDGLQNASEKIPTPTKLELISRLEQSGLRAIELTSVVSPRAIPQLADCRELLRDSCIGRLVGDSQLRLPVLVPNLKGLEIALQHGVKEVAVFISATEGFSKENVNCTVAQGIERARQVATKAVESKVAVRGYVSCIFADPYDGRTAPEAVLHCVMELLKAGCYEVSLGDTLGIGTPADVRSLVTYLTNNGVPLDALAGHFHDTYGQAVANVWVAYNCGIRVFDSSVAGLGGCPFAPGAKGNVATEDVAYMFQQAGIETGVDMSRLVATGAWIAQQLSLTNCSRAGAAILSKNKHLSDSISRNRPTKLPSIRWNLTSKTDGLQIYRTGVNLKIVLDRPRNGNALTAAMISGLTTVVNDANNDSMISRIILTANGKFFCTGMDLGKQSSPVATGGSKSNDQFERLTKLFEVIDQSPKVTIACLNGPAFGGGVGLAFVCDIRICVKTAAVQLSEAKLGLCPATISKYVIREWGVSFAREAMLSARPVTTEELRNRSLVSGIAEDQHGLSRHVDDLLTELKVASPEASRMSKELVRIAWAHGGDESQATRIKALFDQMMSPESQSAHGLKEFQARRKVDWDAYVLRHREAKL